MARGVLDIFLIYQFLRRLVTPFDQWDAFKSGVIDKNGKVIIDDIKRTAEQKATWGYYDRLVANLKKLLGTIPGGKTRIASFAAALLLLREQESFDVDNMELLKEKFDSYLDKAKILHEEVPANIAGDGKIAGIGVGQQGEPGIRKRKKVIKRKELENV
jgi:hypothetical protein